VTTTDNNHNAQQDIIVLAADTRATSNRLVVDARADKIHPLARSVYCCGAGTSGDLKQLTRQCYYRMKLLQVQQVPVTPSYDTAAEPTAVDDASWMFDSICHMLQDQLYRQNGQCGANLIVGGTTNSGRCQLRAIHAHGSMDVISNGFTALGSGGLAAMAVLEQQADQQQARRRQAQQQANNSSNVTTTSMSRDEGVQLAVRAVMAGIDNDLGSGSQVNVCVIYGNGTVEHLRAVLPETTVLEDAVITNVVNHKAKYKQSETASEDAPFATNDSSRPDKVVPGVNGFGNVPFAIQSQRSIRIHNPAKDQEDDWNRVLGL
jgi:20S proteasome alpha/beta subunit